MTIQGRTIFALALATLAAGGCLMAPGTKKSPAKEVDAKQMLTPLQTEFGYVTPRDLKQDGALKLAMIDVDFTKPNLVYDFSVVVFEPDGSDALLAKAAGQPTRLNTLAELRDHLLPFVPDARIGLVMMLDGEPLGIGGKTPRPEQNAFFREFATMMDAAGIAYTYIVPGKIAIIR
jgi:hypothetical protein